MAWTIKIDKKALKEINALDKPIKKRIRSFLVDKLSKTTNPRSLGEALTGSLKPFWRYRVGDYRLICRMEEKVLLVVVLKVRHRRDVYKR